jgi:hypothetical protein
MFQFPPTITSKPRLNTLVFLIDNRQKLSYSAAFNSESTAKDFLADIHRIVHFPTSASHGDRLSDLKLESDFNSRNPSTQLAAGRSITLPN